MFKLLHENVSMNYLSRGDQERWGVGSGVQSEGLRNKKVS